MRNSATTILNVLDGTYGTLEPDFPTDPYQFIVWWHCGYPQSQKACAKGWASLTRATKIEPDDLLQAPPSRLTEALRTGGMVPELRALRLKEIAERVLKEFGGDLTAALRAMSRNQARAALVRFPNIANPGADRILLFGGMAPIRAGPENRALDHVHIPDFSCVEPLFALLGGLHAQALAAHLHQPPGLF
jgi:endonuclease-3